MTSTYYSLVCTVTGLISFKGSKAALMRKMKSAPGVYFLAITSRPVGAIFNV